MLTKLFAGLIVAAGLTVTGYSVAGSGKSCCFPGSECCFPGSECCTDCCAAGADCCFSGSPCCDAGADCCFPGSPCCAAGAGCCESFVSADVAPAVKADQPAKADVKTSKLVVDDMSCLGCAKSVTKALTAVAGVESAVVDLKAQTVTVTPKGEKAPSPKALWEAVEKAGYTPTKLAGPDGTFEKRPTK